MGKRVRRDFRRADTLSRVVGRDIKIIDSYILGLTPWNRDIASGWGRLFLSSFLRQVRKVVSSFPTWLSYLVAAKNYRCRSALEIRCFTYLAWVETLSLV